MTYRTVYCAALKTSAASFVLTIGLLAGPAFAQAQASEPPEATAEEETEIIVTGSLIQNPNLTLSSPVNATTAEEIELRQSNNAESLLREIPGVVAGFGNAVNIGNPGASFVNLRGLGDVRNLVLLDGVRLVPVDQEGHFDLNNIPLALIQRTDVLTGGASTTYGADAVSGVVNFITDKRFTGLKLIASGQVTEEGDGSVKRVELTGGTTFGGARGHAILSVGYQQVDPVYMGDRSYSAIPYNAATGLYQGSTTTIPSTLSVPGSPLPLQVQDGLLVPRYLLFNDNTDGMFQTEFERYNAYGSFRYELSDAFEVYARGIYSRNIVNVFAPYGGAFSIPVSINISNPFLTAAQRSTLCARNSISASACAAAALATNPADPAYRAVNSILNRRVSEFGLRNNTATTDFYDLRAGVRGNLTDSINWDIAASYGNSDRVTDHKHYAYASRIQQSTLAVPGTGGTPVCINPANGCVPVNWFHTGPVSQREIDFIRLTWVEGQEVSLTQFNAKIGGDFGWNLPWASDPISFAIGGEYRKYKASQTSDETTEVGDISGGNGAVPAFTGGYSVYEAVAEVNIPLVQDKPFFNELTVEGGVRYSHYEVDAPGEPSYNTTTWKAGGTWSPVDGLRFRGTYARAVRAPNIDELFGPQITVFRSLADDPCANFNAVGNPIPGRAAPTGVLRDVCIAQGAPAAQIGLIQVPVSNEVNATIGGNLNVGPETANSYTFGFVLSPEQIPNLTITADYYNIKVRNAISSPTTTDAIDLCFNNLSVTNPNCLSIGRDRLTGSLRGSTTTVRGLFLGLSNLGRLATDGIDVSINYRHDLGFARWAISATGNWTNKSVSQATPSSVVRDCVGVYNTACQSIEPEFQWYVRNTLSFEGADVSLLWRHLDSQRSSVPLFRGTIPGLGEVDFNRLPAYDYFDLTTRIHVSDDFTFVLAIQNLFDKKPPLAGRGAGTFSFNTGNTFPSTYDVLGRRFAFTVNATF